MRRLLQRYLKYAGTSIAGTLVDTLVLWLLSDLIFKDVYWVQYIVSPVISFQCAVVTNYTIFYFYVWRDRTREDRSRHNFFRRFLAYDLSCSTVFLLRLGLLLIIEKIFGWDVIICNLIAMCFSGIINFIMNNLVIFRLKSQICRNLDLVAVNLIQNISGFGTGMTFGITDIFAITTATITPLGL